MAFNYDIAKFIAFRDVEALARVRAIKKADITKHANPDFKIKVIDDKAQFYGEFAADIVMRIQKAADENRKCVMILPVGPVPQYAVAAHIINNLRISCKHLVTFNMDEYADQDGNTAPLDWAGSFQSAMYANFFNRLDPELRPLPENIHFPTTAVINDYSKMIEDAGSADCCYGGVGWCGHIAFWESDLGHEFGDDLESYKKAGARCVELTAMTIMQNALHSFGGDWSWVPPKANTIGIKDIVESRFRSFWLDGDQGGGVSWQRFIARLAAHGPVNTLVPASMLQTVPGTYSILSGVADDVEICMS